MAIITGTSGNDPFSGTVGVFDTAVIDAVQDGPLFSYVNRAWVVTSSQGTDTLASVEQVQFLDATFSLSVGGLVTLAQNTGFTFGSLNSDLLRLSDGSMLSLWRHPTGGLQFQKITQSGELSGSAAALSGPGATSSNVAATSLGTGGFVAAWQDTADILFQRYDLAGNPLGVVQVANVTTNLTQFDPAITALNNGSFVVAWEDSAVDGSGNGVFARVFGSNGTAITGDFRINTATIGNQQDVALAALSGGGFVAVYSNGSFGLSFQKYTAGGTVVGSETVIAGFSATKCAVTALSADRFLVVGLESNVLKYQIIGAGGLPEGGSPIAISTTAPNLNQPPEVVTLSDGGWVVAWSEQAGGSTRMQTQRYDSQGNAVGAANTLALVDPFDMHIVADSAGGYTVQYWQSDGGRLFEIRYDADNLPVLPTITGDAAANIITLGNVSNQGIRIDGGAGNDTLTGSVNNDILDGTDGADRLTGGAGNDIYIVNGDERIIEQLDGGTDMVVVRQSYSLSARNVENIRLLGISNGNLSGNALDNVIYGNRADNVINGRAGVDTMIGGNGNDTYYLDNPNDVVIETANGGIDTIIAAGGALPNNVENFRATGSSASTIQGNALDNILIGNSGANQILGGGGADILQGRGGDDTYFIDGGDLVVEGIDRGIDTVLTTVSYQLDDNVEIARLTSLNVVANLTGNALDNTLIGNDAANVLDGGAGADTMTGNEGNDLYIVDNAGDRVVETAFVGIDEVRASVSFSLDQTAVENLTLTGRNAIDGTGNGLNNIIRGNSAGNVLTAGEGVDELYGNGGNDTLVAGLFGGDLLVGGTGNDTYFVSSAGSQADTIVELIGQGTDTVLVSIINGDYVLAENIENLTMTALFGSASAHGNSLANRLTGADGDNLLDGASGADTMIGLGGDDTYVVDNSGDICTEAIGGGEDTIESSIGRTLGANIENLRLTGASAISGTGNGLDNEMTGNTGSNTLSGLAGRDVLVGGGGADILLGGDDDDLLIGGASNDFIDGGNGIDTVNYRAVTAAVTVDLAITATGQNTGTGSGIDRLIGIENVIGSDLAADTLSGDGANNRLVGGGGTDLLDGRSGNDLLQGGEGTDTLIGGAGDDTLDGGNGIDTASYAASLAGVTVDLGNLDPQATGDGTDRLLGIENLTGSATGADTLTGDYLANTIDGGGGNDRIEGGDGNDTLIGGDGNDTASYANATGGVLVNLALGTASDGAGGKDVLTGFENILGGQFDDSLRGDGVANVIEGGIGRDVLRGGTGNDTFVYRSVDDSTVAIDGRDLIADLTAGDRIDLSAIDANSSLASDQAFTFIGTASFSNVAGQLRATTTSIEGDVNGDGFADFAITISVATAPVAADFVL